jgi:regulator of sirC expression with transglutaminase-like and TPR domain
MEILNGFAGDEEFSKLLNFRCDIDVTRAALELARDFEPVLSFQPTLSAIDEIADSLRPEITRLRSDTDALERMCEALTRNYGFGGDPTCFDRPESSYLNRVVETGRGIPISLSLIYIAVGERLGLPLTGVATPAHFLCRFEGAAGPLFVDAFRMGRILDPEECVDWIANVSGFAPNSIRTTLEPAAPRAIITRMLNNLRALHLRHCNWQAAERVLLRLLALRPSSFSDRRDLAAVSLLLQRPGRVVDLLERATTFATDEDAQAASEMLDKARQMIVAWN